MLLHGAWADVQLRGDLLVAAALHQQLQHLFVARCDLDVVRFNMKFPRSMLTLRPCFSCDPGCDLEIRSNCFAKASPERTKDKPL